MNKPEFPTASYADAQLLKELMPRITELHENHLTVAKSWEITTLTSEVETARVSGEFDPLETPLSPEAKSSVTLGLLTEEGLPYYVLAILRNIDKDHPFARWGHRWTAEEHKHGVVLRDVLRASGAIDMNALDNDCAIMLEKAETPNPGSFAETILYPAAQERATRLSHVGSARLLPGSFRTVKQAFTTVASDENLHYNFYAGLSDTGFEVNPSAMTIAAAMQFINFGMPGKGIPGYIKHAVRVSNANIYGLPEQEDIFKSLIDRWNVYDLSNLSPDAEYARDALVTYMAELSNDAERVRQKRDERKNGQKQVQPK